jgi:hypothetical protein
MIYNNSGPIYSTLTGKGDGYLCQPSYGCAPCYGCLGGPNTYADLSSCRANCSITTPPDGCGSSVNCPEGYCRTSACDTENANYPIFSCSSPFQINCYQYTTTFDGNTVNCVSYCDNV